jgi:pimeloyl-ACP methyl ester carboxylesterase
MPSAPSLPPAVDAARVDLETATAGRVSFYRAGPKSSSSLPPAVLVHSVNAAGSAAEVKPLFEHERQRRRVYAIDLPGFGFSERSDRRYTPRLMTDAVHAVIAEARRELDVGDAPPPVDVVGVSLSCEFVARAHVEAPQSVRRLALVSPTGFAGHKRREGAEASAVGPAWLGRALSSPLWADGLYNNLTRPKVIRFFLEKTWGRKEIDEDMYAAAVATTRQPGAKYAPLCFVSAGLFSADITRVYEGVTCPVWASMPTRGDFTDYRGRDVVCSRANWQFHSIDGGALPYFEAASGFIPAIDAFWTAP